MVTTIYKNTKIEANKVLYSFENKISSFLELGEIDRKNQKVYILPKYKIMMCLEIKDDNSLELDISKQSKYDTNTVDLAKIIDKIIDYKSKYHGKQLLLDDDYNIICHSEALRKDFVPFDIDNLEKIELGVNAVAPYVDDMYKDKESYLLYCFPDTIKSVDEFTVHHLLFLMIKDYVEKRFPVIESKNLENMRIISKQGFDFIFYHLASVLRVKDIYKEVLKTGFDVMSKTNYLPHIPTENWYVHENVPNIKTKRLLELKNKKESVIEKIGKKLQNKPEVKEISNPRFIPNYLAHLFTDDSPVINWVEFVGQCYQYEMGVNYNRWTDCMDSYYMNPAIIIPDSSIFNLEKDDILFMGYDGETIKLVLNSKTMGKKETEEESKLAKSLQTQFLGRYGIDCEIIFDYEKLVNKQIVSYIDDDE